MIGYKRCAGAWQTYNALCLFEIRQYDSQKIGSHFTPVRKQNIAPWKNAMDSSIQILFKTGAPSRIAV